MAEPSREISALREFAHELRGALSPITSALDLLRLQKFSADASRQAAETVSRALQRALTTLGSLEERFGAAQADAPASHARAAPQAAAADAAPAGARILIVDDSDEVRTAYREVLLALGHEVTEAGDAESALRAIARATPDAAVIDVHLPTMSGYRLAREIRARAGPGIRLIMLSGVTLDETTRRLSVEAGFDSCLDKMAGPVALHRMLEG